MDEQEKKLEGRITEAADTPDDADVSSTGADPNTPDGAATDGSEGPQDLQEPQDLQKLHDLEESLDGLGAALRKVAQSLESLADARTAFSRVGWAACTLMPLSVLLQGAVAVILSVAYPGWADTPLLWVVSFAPLYCVCTPLALWILGSVPAHPPAPRPLGFWRTAALFPVGLLLTYAGSAVSTGILYIMNQLFHTTAENPVAEVLMRDNGAALRTALVVFIAPVVEEFVFRKVILDRTRAYGEKLALMVSAVLFALEHGNISQFLYALLLGLGFGYIYLRTGRLRYTIALHVWINFMGGVAAPLILRYAGTADLSAPVSADLSAPGGVVMLCYSFLLLVLCGSGAAILARNWRRIHFIPAEREIPQGAQFRTACANPGMILLALSFIVTSLWVLAA